MWSNEYLRSFERESEKIETSISVLERAFVDQEHEKVAIDGYEARVVVLQQARK